MIFIETESGQYINFSQVVRIFISVSLEDTSKKVLKIRLANGADEIVLTGTLHECNDRLGEILNLVTVL